MAAMKIKIIFAAIIEAGKLAFLLRLNIISPNDSEPIAAVINKIWPSPQKSCHEDVLPFILSASKGNSANKTVQSSQTIIVSIFCLKGDKGTQRHTAQDFE